MLVCVTGHLAVTQKRNRQTNGYTPFPFYAKCKMRILLVSILALFVVGTANAQRKVKVVENASTEVTESNNQKFIKRKVAIGRFSNETQYAKGIFYGRTDGLIRQYSLYFSVYFSAKNKSHRMTDGSC